MHRTDIRGAALDVVRRMGVLDEIRMLRTDVRGGSVVNAAGWRVASMDGDTFGGRVHGDAEPQIWAADPPWRYEVARRASPGYWTT